MVMKYGLSECWQAGRSDGAKIISLEKQVQNPEY